MRKADILKLPSMPMAGPSYPAGPYRFINREFLVITYETDPELIRAGLPEPLEPIDQAIVHYEWIKMPDSSGFGSYTESGLVSAQGAAALQHQRHPVAMVRPPVRDRGNV